jgi:hypothetical protein
MEVPFNYTGFKQWTSTFKTREASFVDKCKLAAINNISSGMHISAERKTLLSKWRGRTATNWRSTNEEVPTQKKDGNDLDYDDDENDNNILDKDAIDDIVTALLLKCNGNDTTEYQDFQAESLSAIFTPTLEKLTPAPIEEKDADNNLTPRPTTINIQHPETIMKIFKELNVSEDDNDNENDVVDNEGSEEFTMQLDISPDNQLGVDQNCALVKVLSHVLDVITGQSTESSKLNLIVHGGPGVVKVHSHEF